MADAGAEPVTVATVQVTLVDREGRAVRDAALPARPSLPEILRIDDLFAVPDGLGHRHFVLERGLPDPLYREARCVVLAERRRAADRGGA